MVDMSFQEQMFPNWKEILAATTYHVIQLTLPDVISVRQTRSLPPASFRFLVTEDTFALGYVLGTINPH